MQMTNKLLIIAIAFVFLVMYGCFHEDATLDEKPSRATPPPQTPPPQPDSYPEKEPACKDVRENYYDASNCEDQCKPNEECKYTPKAASWWSESKLVLESKPCYACNPRCSADQYLDDSKCGGSCKEDKKCVEISELPGAEGFCYGCVSTCEAHGLSSSKACDNKCGENEYCKEVRHPDANLALISDLVCYKCAPSPIIDGGSNETCKKFSEWVEKWSEQCKPDGKEEGTRTRTCADNPSINEKETKERDCQYDFVIPTFIINGNESDTFAPATICPGATCTVGVTLSSAHKLDFPIFVVPGGFLKGKTNYLLDDDQATLDRVAKDKQDALKTILCGSSTCTVQVMFKPILCKSSNKCTIQTDWGKDPVQQTDTAKVDFTFSLDDKNEYKLGRTLSAGATCTTTIDFQPSPCKISTLTPGATPGGTCTTTIKSETWTCKDRPAAGPTSATGTTLSPGATCTIQVKFQPSSCGEWGPCTNGIQTRTCPDSNNCGTTTESQSCQTCTENWQCSDWSTCVGGTKTKTCNDLNNCGTNNTKPSLSQSCQTCTESWTCDSYGSWSSWTTCSESSTQTRTRTRSCTDANNCGTTTSKPQGTETESQSCTYTPTQQKPEYSSHESTLGSNIENLDYNSASVSRDLSSTGGTYGYRILNIPAKNTITVCVTVTGGSGSLGFFYYPQYHYGFDFTDTTPGCTDIYNKNDWPNGVLVHLGDPTPANVVVQTTVTKK